MLITGVDCVWNINTLFDARFEILLAVLEIQDFWDMTQFRLVNSYRRFTGSSCLHLQGIFGPLGPWRWRQQAPVKLRQLFTNRDDCVTRTLGSSYFQYFSTAVFVVVAQPRNSFSWRRCPYPIYSVFEMYVLSCRLKLKIFCACILKQTSLLVYRNSNYKPFGGNRLT